MLELGTGSERELAYKRLPMFKTEEEARSYQALYKEYVEVLGDRIGLQVVPSDTVRFTVEDKDRIIIYIVQEKLPAGSIGHRAIYCLPPDDVNKLALAVLQKKMKKVFDFNREHRGKLEVGFDGQISNWAIIGFDPESPKLGEDVELVYFDASTPLVQKNGEELLDPELFLRNAPSFMVWIIRLFFLEDVMTRYYDFRKVEDLSGLQED